MNKANFFKCIEKNPTSRTSIRKITINLIRNMKVQTGYQKLFTREKQNYEDLVLSHACTFASPFFIDGSGVAFHAD